MLSTDDKKDITKVFEACCIPEANVIYEHCMSCIQESWETIDHYITDVIKLAENSWYGGLCDDSIRDKLVSGIKVRVKLLGTKSLKLDQTIEVLKTNQALKLWVKNMLSVAADESVVN